MHEFGVCLNTPFIHLISKKLPNLCDLTLNLVEAKANYGIQLRREHVIEINSLTSLSIRCNFWDQLKNVPIVWSGQLKRLSLSADSWFGCNDEFPHIVNLAEKNSNLLEMTIACSNDKRKKELYYDDYGDRIRDLITVLPKLKKIRVPYNWQTRETADDIARILFNFKHISQFVACKHITNGQGLSISGEDEWRLTNEGDNGNSAFDIRSEKRKFKRSLKRFAEKNAIDADQYNLKFHVERGECNFDTSVVAVKRRKV